MNTFNISTASALLLASMGVKIAKHGNKSASGKVGSADVLLNLGNMPFLSLVRSKHYPKIFYSAATTCQLSL